MNEPGTHKLSEALQGQEPAGTEAAAGAPPEPQGHGSTPLEIAETTRRLQESQNNGKNNLDRENHLVNVGRAQQTHG